MIKNFGWMIFIDANKEILRGKTEVVETTYLLAAILKFIIDNKPNQISVGVFENNDVNPLKHIFDLFRIKDPDLFKTTTRSLNDRLKDVIFCLCVLY